MGELPLGDAVVTGEEGGGEIVSLIDTLLVAGCLKAGPERPHCNAQPWGRPAKLYRSWEWYHHDMSEGGGVG